MLFNFFSYLRERGFRIHIADYDRLGRLFSCSGKWSIADFKESVRCIIVRSELEDAKFDIEFGRFFAEFHGEATSIGEASRLAVRLRRRRTRAAPCIRNELEPRRPSEANARQSVSQDKTDSRLEGLPADAPVERVPAHAAEPLPLPRMVGAQAESQGSVAVQEVANASESHDSTDEGISSDARSGQSKMLESGNQIIVDETNRNLEPGASSAALQEIADWRTDWRSLEEIEYDTQIEAFANLLSRIASITYGQKAEPLCDETTVGSESISAEDEQHDDDMLQIEREGPNGDLFRELLLDKALKITASLALTCDSTVYNELEYYRSFLEMISSKLVAEPDSIEATEEFEAILDDYIHYAASVTADPKGYRMSSDEAARYRPLDPDAWGDSEDEIPVDPPEQLRHEQIPVDEPGLATETYALSEAPSFVGPREFFFRGADVSLLNPEALDDLADALHFVTHAESRETVDLKATIEVFCRTCTPTIQYEKHRQRQTILILSDVANPDNGIFDHGRAMTTALRQRGVVAKLGFFYNVPNLFSIEGEPETSFDDFDESKETMVVLIVTGGSPESSFPRHLVDDLRRWPFVACICTSPVGLPPGLEENSALSLPVFDSTRHGLEGIARWLSHGHLRPRALLGWVDPSDSLATRLGDALQWVCCCALLQPIDLRFAERLRQQLFSRLPREALSLMPRLPGTVLTNAGLLFSQATTRELLAIRESRFPGQAIHWRREIENILTSAPPPERCPAYGTWIVLRTANLLSIPRASAELKENLNLMLSEYPEGREYLSELLDAGGILQQSVPDTSETVRSLLQGQAQARRSCRPPVEWVRIPSGKLYRRLQVGAGEYVIMEQFYIARFLTTNSQLCSFLNEYGSSLVRGGQYHGAQIIHEDICRIRRAGGSWSVPRSLWDHPVAGITWYGAKEFCRFYGYDLPSAEEWEYAARDCGDNMLWAGTNDEKRVGDYMWHEGNSHGRSHPVGLKKSNALGLYDMSGNVWEWTDTSVTAGSRLTRSKAELHRVIRGGSYDYDYDYLYTIYSEREAPSSALSDIGFRVVMKSWVEDSWQ